MNTRAFVSLLALGLAACATVAAEPDPVQSAAPSAPRFDEAIAAFGAADKAAMPPKCATLFVGASSIRFWRTLKEDFPDRTVIQRGFGGSTVWEVDHYFDRVVAPYIRRKSSSMQARTTSGSTSAHPTRSMRTSSSS